MNKHLAYGLYVARHKWYVFHAARRLGVPLLSAVLHDWDKFLPSEWFPYVASFYGPKYPKLAEISGDARNRALDSGHYKEAVREAFDFAWLLHQKRNRHHWQWWVLPEDDGGVKLLAMSDSARREMLADWIGAGLAQNNPDVVSWYLKNQRKIQLHDETRAWIESALGIAQATQMNPDGWEQEVKRAQGRRT